MNLPSLLIASSVFVNFFIADWYTVFCQKCEEIVSMYPAMTPRKPESVQVSLLNPPQHRHFAHSTILGNGAGSNVFRAPPGYSFF